MKLSMEGTILQNTGIASKVLKEICDLGKQYQIEQIILFGSRARGDYHKTSDIDLAVTGGDVAGFSLAVDEETQTLLEYDIVNLDGSVQSELLDSIEKEGVLLYEKD